MIMDPLQFASDHSCPSGHHYNCVCDICCPPDDFESPPIFIYTCTCETCDPGQIAMRMLDDDPVTNTEDSAVKDPQLPPESRVVSYDLTTRETIEICEELYGFSVTSILRSDGFTGSITFVLDMKEAEEVATAYLAASPCPKIIKQDANEEVASGINVYSFHLWPKDSPLWGLISVGCH